MRVLHWIKALTTGTIISVILTSGTITTVQAQEGSPSATPSATPYASTSSQPTYSQATTSVTTIPTQTIQGEIQNISGQIVTIKTNSNTKQLPITGNSKITRDNNQVSLSQLQPGDQATATINPTTNQVLTLSATSKQATTTTTWIIAAIIAALILIGLIYWLIRKMRRQHITTTTTNLR